MATLLIGVEGEGREAIFRALQSATARIAEEGEDFDVSLEALVHVTEMLLEREDAWRYIANWGEVFSNEDEASTYADECFADAAGRYLSSAGSEESAALADHQGSDDQYKGNRTTFDSLADRSVLVVTLTLGYEGEDRSVEKTLTTRSDLSSALSAIAALARRGEVAVVHIHQAPGTLEEVLTEDRLLVNYPELLGV